jgi:hypothetical protein
MVISRQKVQFVRLLTIAAISDEANARSTSFCNLILTNNNEIKNVFPVPLGRNNSIVEHLYKLFRRLLQYRTIVAFVTHGYMHHA